MRIAIGSDDDTPLARGVIAHLTGAGHEVVEALPLGAPWPDVGRVVGETVAAAGADRGVVCCWTGTGVSIAANKVAGVRAALCADAETARGARRWNDANVLALSLRRTSEAVAAEIIDAFLAEATDASEAPHISRVEGP